MKVGTETKHKGQACKWRKLQGEVVTLVSQGSIGSTPPSSKNKRHPCPEPSHTRLPPGSPFRLLPGNTTLCKSRQGVQWTRTEHWERNSWVQSVHCQPHCALQGKRRTDVHPLAASSTAPKTNSVHWIPSGRREQRREPLSPRPGNVCSGTLTHKATSQMRHTQLQV